MIGAQELPAAGQPGWHGQSDTDDSWSLAPA